METLDGLLSPGECDVLIRRFSRLASAGSVVHGVVDADLAALVASRLSLAAGEYVSAQLYLNRYGVGDRIAPHRDGRRRELARNSTSRKTILLYLNGPPDFEGGHTIAGSRSIVPRAGTALLMDQDLEHEAAVVTSGTKYVVRGDVMTPGRHAPGPPPSLSYSPSLTPL